MCCGTLRSLPRAAERNTDAPVSAVEDAALSACERASRRDQQRVSQHMPKTGQSSSKQLFEHQNAPQRARGRCARELNCSGFIKSIEDNTAVMRFGSMDHICGRQNASHRTVTGRLPSSLQEHDCRASGRPARRRAMAPSFTGHRVRCMGVLDPPLRQSIEPCCPRGRLRWRRDSGYSHRTVTYCLRM